MSGESPLEKIVDDASLLIQSEQTTDDLASEADSQKKYWRGKGISDEEVRDRILGLMEDGITGRLRYALWIGVNPMRLSRIAKKYDIEIPTRGKSKSKRTLGSSKIMPNSFRSDQEELISREVQREIEDESESEYWLRIGFSANNTNYRNRFYSRAKETGRE